MTAKVLIVDDIEFNIKLLETKLKNEYYHVITAFNGVEAIQKAKEFQPDIILMDVMMPIMDGFQASEKIKNTPETSHIPIILVTALNAQEDRIKGLQSGADDFLTKPINDHALMSRLRSLVRLKIMTDELRVRDITSAQFGLSTQHLETRKKIEGANVLLIEDDITQAQKIRDKLASQGVNCDIINDGKNIIQDVNKKEYALVITSTLLINDDGLRICSELRNDAKTRFIPTLILVDENDPQTLDRGFDIGVTDYLTAPVDLDELSARTFTQIKRYNYQKELKTNYLQSLTISITDPLTSIYNRRYFDTHGYNIFTQSIANKRPMSVIMVDIDNFKSVNDTYGHPSGDEVIKEIAKKITANLRITDMCARYGGEEFIIILSNTMAFAGQFVGERIRMMIESIPFSIPVSPGQINITVSMGISEILSDSDTLETVVARADANLYKAKHQGKNQIVGDSSE